MNTDHFFFFSYLPFEAENSCRTCFPPSFLFLLSERNEKSFVKRESEVWHAFFFFSPFFSPSSAERIMMKDAARWFRRLLQDKNGERQTTPFFFFFLFLTG